MSVDVSSSTTGALDGDLASRISYLPPTAQEIPACFAIESASYPPDEAATLEGLNYRLANASDYFQCAILDETTIIGFVCSTRCEEFEEESMSTHVDTGSLLAIHSVVVQEEYRRKGIATAMLKAYLETVQNENVDGSIQSFVLLAKSHLLGFYVNCGFRVNRPSPIVHGQELWYELEKPLLANNSPRDDESWFCKTEEFKRPFPEVKPHLENHKLWVNSLRREGKCITSGYRVDSEGKPGGGGLMFLAARSYEEAFQIVKQDPLVANDCVEWELNGWIGQVGDLQMK
jgi:uncharacterized protein YciI/GNAT superfamily N-acetyltransferase